VNDLDRDAAFQEALGQAMTLPTWVLRRWERRAAARVAVGTPTRAEVARLLAVRSVLRSRGER
jgi:hypothetical protein